MKRLFPLLCLAAVLTAWGYDPPTDGNPLGTIP